MARRVTCWCRPTETVFSMSSIGRMASFCGATAFVEKLNWATGIDASGRPRLSDRIPTKEGTYICPGIVGATNWFSPSYNPNTGLFYVMALESCSVYFAKSKPFTPGETYYGTGTKFPAVNTHRKFCWHSPFRTGKRFGDIPRRVAATRGEERSQPQVDSCFLPMMPIPSKRSTPKPDIALWHFNTGQSFSASPMTYAVDGVQYVAISAGSDVFSFALPH